MKQWKRLCGVALSGVLALSLTFSGMADTTSEAKAKKATLKTKKVTLTVGKRKQLRLKRRKSLVSTRLRVTRRKLHRFPKRARLRH